MTKDEIYLIVELLVCAVGFFGAMWTAYLEDDAWFHTPQALFIFLYYGALVCVSILSYLYQ